MHFRSMPLKQPIIFLWAVSLAGPAVGEEQGMRVATYNTSLYRNNSGQLIEDLDGGENAQAKQVAEVIQRVQPDVILLNEFDYDPDGRAAEIFCTQYLNVSQNGCEPIFLRYRFAAPVNTGRPSGRDLSKNGKTNDPADAIGFGRHEGQYGMLLLSQYPIDEKAIRTFQNFLWRDMPEAQLPVNPQTGQPFYDDEDLAVLRLSSKSLWDVPVLYRGSTAAKIHFLCSHPTPPVFDGPEDRNGLRNHDEIRLLADYIDPQRADYLVDDKGREGGLAKDSRFVILGDLNADPVDGQGVPGTMDQLLKHPRVNNSFTPSSAGGSLASKQQAELNPNQKGDPAHDTSNFGGEGFSNLRIDYVLPSQGLEVIDGGIFWPGPDEAGGNAVTASDHRLVWLDVHYVGD
jgi:endonuclease/exonuclease/phosphatase family metal-dependent hydrolase